MAISSQATACAQHGAVAYKVVDVAEFAADIHNDSTAYILDVRTPEEFEQGHINNAHNLDWLNQDEFKTGAEYLPKDKTLYVYCRSGKRSAEASQYLTTQGYKVVDLDGGYQAWQNAPQK